VRAGERALARDEAELVDDAGRDLVGRAGVLERQAALAVVERFERADLRRQQRGRHEVAAARLHALADQLGVAGEVHEAHVALRAVEQVAVAALEGRAGDDGAAAGAGLAAHPVAHGLEPGPAVVVGEGRAGGHLRDVRLGVELVSRSARAVAIVVLPDPEIPITTTWRGCAAMLTPSSTRAVPCRRPPSGQR
jgi:hypothetical protein